MMMDVLEQRLNSDGEVGGGNYRVRYRNHDKNQGTRSPADSLARLVATSRLPIVAADAI